MNVDMHAHYVPPKVLSVLERDPSPYGAKLLEAAGSGQCVQFTYGLTIRPFFPELLDLERRWQVMDQQGVDRQILSVWTDLSGYGFPLEAAARWHRLLNEVMCDEARQHLQRLSALVYAEDVSRLTFAQLVESIRAELELTQKIKSFSGKEVEIQGFIVPAGAPDLSFFLLSRVSSIGNYCCEAREPWAAQSLLGSGLRSSLSLRALCTRLHGFR